MKNIYGNKDGLETASGMKLSIDLEKAFSVEQEKEIRQKQKKSEQQTLTTKPKL